MLLPNLIGSLLALQGNGIGDEEIKNIEQLVVILQKYIMN